jgi:hypothetical protein
MRQWIDRKLALRGDSRGKYLIRSEILDEFQRTAQDVGYEVQVRPIQGIQAEQLRAQFANLGEAIAVYGMPVVIPNPWQIESVSRMQATSLTGTSSPSEIIALQQEKAVLSAQIESLTMERDQLVKIRSSLESQLKESQAENSRLNEQASQWGKVQEDLHVLKSEFQEIQKLYVIIGDIFARMAENAEQGHRSDPTEILDELFPDPAQQGRIQDAIEATYNRLKKEVGGH